MVKILKSVYDSFCFICWTESSWDADQKPKSKIGCPFLFTAFKPFKHPHISLPTEYDTIRGSNTARAGRHQVFLRDHVEMKSKRTQ